MFTRNAGGIIRSLSLCLPCTTAVQQMPLPSALPGRPAALSWLPYMQDGWLQAVHLKLLVEQQPHIYAAPALLSRPGPQRCSRRCCHQSCLRDLGPDERKLAMQDGRLEAVHLELLAEQQRLEERLCSASAMCMHCHSGGLMKPILCQNGECSVSLITPL